MSATYAALTGTGSYAPEKILTNLDLEKRVDTTDEWIQRRTGIVQRHIAQSDVETSDLCLPAVRRAIKKAGIDPLDIDVIIVATSTPDSPFPSIACRVQGGIGAKNACAFDLAAACSGFIYGLNLANDMIQSGRYRTILVIGGEVLSKIVDWTDRNTCVLFGDAAGAAIVQATDQAKGILASYVGSDGDYADPYLLGVPSSRSRTQTSGKNVGLGPQTIKMQGQQVFRRSVRMMPLAAQHVLDKAGVTIDEIDLFIPHQANIRLIKAVGKRLGVSNEKVFCNLSRYGNTSAASIIVALDEAICEGRAKAGDLILLAAFGAGITWGSALIRL